MAKKNEIDQFDLKNKKEDFSVYKIVSRIEEADELTDLLEKNKIPFSIIDNAFEVDVTFSGNNTQRNFQILLKKSDFEKVNDLAEKNAESQISMEDTDHYLFAFTNAELFEILEKRDEWSPFDYKLSQKILISRGENISPEMLQNYRLNRIDELAEGERGPWLQTFLGYIFALAGGLLGLIIGWYLWRAKKTLPDGAKVYTYVATQRRHGMAITMISGAAIIFWTVMFLSR